MERPAPSFTPHALYTPQESPGFLFHYPPDEKIHERGGAGDLGKIKENSGHLLWEESYIFVGDKCLFFSFNEPDLPATERLTRM